jgi:hypothetical protein
MKNGLILLLFAISSLSLLGCSTGPTKHKVTGVVELDGQPIPEGEVTFLSDTKDVPSEGARIKDGKYEAQLATGAYKATFQASKSVPLAPGEATGTPGEKEKLVSLIPAYYDSNPQPADVKGPTQIDFKLSSKKQ